MSQPGEQAIAIHILHNILWSKGNQNMGFGQYETITKMGQGD